MSAISVIPQFSTMTSREISTLVNSRHADVCRSIDKLGVNKVIQGYTPQPYTSEQNGQTYYEYYISKRDSYVIVAQFSPEFTAKLVDRWQELESQQSKQLLPNNFLEALELLVTKEKQLIEKSSELEAAKPAIEFVERYVESTGNMGFRQLAKLLRIKENDFRAFLQDNQIMYKLGGEWTPYAQHINSGRFVMKVGTARNDHAFHSAKFTPKGVAWVSQLWSEK
jgi:phage antirepressor YoqD-like protein